MRPGTAGIPARGPCAQSERVFGRTPRNQVTTMSRFTMTAVKNDVMMPRPSVTAKPRTGPEPS